VCAVAAWDSSIHDSIYLNRVTEGQCKADFDQCDVASCSLVDRYVHFAGSTLVPAYPTAWFQITEYSNLHTYCSQSLKPDTSVASYLLHF